MVECIVGFPVTPLTTQTPLRSRPSESTSLPQLEVVAIQTSVRPAPDHKHSTRFRHHGPIRSRQ